MSAGGPDLEIPAACRDGGLRPDSADLGVAASRRLSEVHRS
jgi:hypothetical protein